MLRPARRRTTLGLCCAVAALGAACARPDAGADRESAAAAPPPAAGAAPAAPAPPAAPVDSPAPSVGGGPAPAPAPAPRASGTATPPPAAAPRPRAESSGAPSGATRAPVTPERMDSAGTTPRMSPPSRPNDATPSIPTRPPTMEPAPPPGDAPDATVARLEREARALASTAGCADAGGCRVAPIGARACGGPRDFIAYCRATTDSARLFAKLAELERAERAANERSGAVSVCSMVMPPAPALAGGRCTAGGER